MDLRIVGSRCAIEGRATLLHDTRVCFVIGNAASSSNRTDFFLGDCQVLVFNFSFEITAARLNLCDFPGLDLEINSF